MLSKLILSPLLLAFFCLGLAVRAVTTAMEWVFGNIIWAFGLGMGE